MSTAAVASAPAALGFGPVLLAVGVVGLTAAGMAGLYARNRKQALLTAAVSKADSALRDEIGGLRNVRERDRLAAELEGLLRGVRAELTQGRDVEAARLVNGLRQRIAAAHTEERMLAEQREDLMRLLDRVPAGLAAKVEDLRREAAREDLALDGQLRLVAELRRQARRLGDAADGLIRAARREDPAFAPPAEAPETAALAAEIADYAERAAFFDEHEAAALRALVEEARRGADRFRLELIREQVKGVYGRLKEQAAQTALFRRDLREFLPFLRKAKGPEAASLRRRMEDLLTLPVLTRADYERAYEAARTIFSEQLDRIADAVLAEKVGAGLADLGYELLDEAGRPIPLVPGAVHTLDLPGEGAGYRVRVKVEGGGLAVRLLRVVGSEAERARLSDYQRQRDLEAGRKWCADLDRLYRALADAGIPLRDQLRREPGEEPLEVVADASAGRARSAAERDAGHERARAELS